MKLTVEDAAERVRLVVVANVKMVAPLPLTVQVPEPIFKVRAPVPVPENVCIVGELLLAEKSRVPVKAPIVMESTLKLVLTVTVPLSRHEFASKVTVAPGTGTDAPPRPPEVADQ